MARLVTSGFEQDSKLVTIEVDILTTSAAISMVTSPVNTGTYAMQFSPTGTATSAQYTFYAANTNNKVYARAWINITTLPNGNAQIMNFRRSTAGTASSVVLLTTGALQLQNSSGTQIGSNSSVLSTNTWYCLEIFSDSSVANGTNEARLNGTVFATGAGNTTVSTARLSIGMNGAVTGTIVFDDVAVNDSTGTSQTSYPGQGVIVRATPNAAGDSNGWLVNVGGTAGAANNYTRVDEVTPNGTTNYNASAVLSASDLYKVSVPTIPTGATINAVVVGGEFANTTGADATASFQWQIEKTSAGTLSKSNVLIPNSTTFVVNAGEPSNSTYPITLYNDPDGSAWTPTTIASMQIGMIVSATNLDPLAVSTVWALVDYTQIFNPTVTNQATTSITSTTATLNGDITGTGGGTINSEGFFYSTTTPNPNILTAGVGTIGVTPSGTTGAFSANVTGLTPGTLYYVNAYAQNQSQTGLTFSYANNSISFTTTSSGIINIGSTLMSMGIG